MYAIRSYYAEYVESLYTQWKENPDQVPREWHLFFEGFDLGQQTPPGPQEAVTSPQAALKQSAVQSLIYRS